MFSKRLNRRTIALLFLCISLLSNWLPQKQEELPSPAKLIDSYFNYKEKCMGRGAFGYGSFPGSKFECSTSLSNDLHIFLDCFCNGENIIVFTIADSSYRNSLGNFAESVRSLSRIPYFVVALDHHIIPFLQDRRIPFYLWHGDDAVGNTKAFVSLEILRRGKRVIFSEMDVYWSRNPLNFFANDYDLEILQHSYHPEINFGFFTAKPTPAAVAVFEEYQRYARTHPGYSLQPTMDQKLLDAILRGPREATVQHHFTGIEQKQINWRYLPLEEFYHNPDAFTYEQSPNRVVSHLSWGLGAPERRMLRAKQLNLWHDPWYFRDSRYVSFRDGALLENLPFLSIFAVLFSRKVLIPAQAQAINALYDIDMQRFACNFDYALGIHFNVSSVEVEIYETDGPPSCERVNGVYIVSVNTDLSIIEKCGDEFMRSPVWVLRHINFDFEQFLTAELHTKLLFSSAIELENAH